MRRDEREIVMIGHRKHPEVEGTMGQSDGGMYLVETVEDVAKISKFPSAARVSHLSELIVAMRLASQTGVIAAILSTGGRSASEICLVLR